MKWMRERDLLIAQTLAFVESVTGKKPEADSPNEHPATDPSAAATLPGIETGLIEMVLTHSQPPKPVRISHPALTTDFQNEIRARVASFRAHQQRFMKERDDYCRATVAKIQAALDKHPPRSRPSR